MLKTCLVAALAALAGTYLGIALYVVLLPGSSTIADAMVVAAAVLGGLAIPALLIAAAVTLVLVVATRRAGRVRRVAVSGMAAAIGGALLGYLATAGTPAIPTPLAIECMSLTWLLAGMLGGLAARGRAD